MSLPFQHLCCSSSSLCHFHTCLDCPLPPATALTSLQFVILVKLLLFQLSTQHISLACLHSSTSSCCFISFCLIPVGSCKQVVCTSSLSYEEGFFTSVPAWPGYVSNNGYPLPPLSFRWCSSTSCLTDQEENVQESRWLCNLTHSQLGRAGSETVRNHIGSDNTCPLPQSKFSWKVLLSLTLKYIFKLCFPSAKLLSIVSADGKMTSFCWLCICEREKILLE